MRKYKLLEELVLYTIGQICAYAVLLTQIPAHRNMFFLSSFSFFPPFFVTRQKPTDKCPQTKAPASQEMCRRGEITIPHRAAYSQN